MTKIHHRHQRPQTSSAKMEGLEEIYKKIERESADVCGEGCPNYSDGYCPPLGRDVSSGSECELQRVCREASRG